MFLGDFVSQITVESCIEVAEFDDYSKTATRKENMSENDVPEEDAEFDQYLTTHLPQFDHYVGKHLLISMYYENNVGELLNRVQMHGIITRVNEALIAVDLQDSNEEFTLPPDLEALEEAPAGEYRLKPSGTVVINPDYLVVYTVTYPADQDQSTSD